MVCKKIKKEEIMRALQQVIDPETGVSVVEMGLIKDVRASGDRVDIKMTLTTPFCPLAEQLQNEVRDKAKIPGVKEVNVELVF